ncbi:MAG TPA: acyltransferase [Chroococcidiopsis sp.]
MQAETCLVQANYHHGSHVQGSHANGSHNAEQIITCGVADRLLKKFPVSVVFFYRESIDHNTLISALQQVLTDFPMFAGILKTVDGNLCIDCNNQGVSLSIITEEDTLDQLLDVLPTINRGRLVNRINPVTAIANQCPVMIIKLTYFACGGMALGFSWHHVIGDMHTFMQFMKAWSNSVNRSPYALPLIAPDRDQYLQENLEDNGNTVSGARYLSTGELLRLAFYLLFQVKDKLSLRFYFSADELNRMKQELSAQANRNLSRNDVLCAHMFSLIAKLDNYNKKRILAIALNYRSRLKLPETLAGNFIAGIKLLGDKTVEPFQLAQQLRDAIDNFEQRHMDFFSTKRFIQENGGIAKIDRFINSGIDPLKRNLLVTNWANFGTYDITFGDSAPCYFTFFGDLPFPWLSIITEGFGNDGLIYSVALPSKLAKTLIQDDHLREVHRYRDRQEVLPEWVEKLSWLL